VLPGWIDAQLHISWSFGADGKNVNEEGEHRKPHIVRLMRVTLMAGFTTVQNVGSPLPRDAIARERWAAILTGIEPPGGEQTGTLEKFAHTCENKSGRRT
jgi:hypothetical protein